MWMNVAVLITSLVAISACQSAMIEDEKIVQGDLAGERWILISLLYDGVQYDVEPTGTYEVTFSKDHEMEIVADCNSCISTYEATSFGTLTIREMGCTKKGCGLGSLGEVFKAALRRADKYDFDGPLLHISNGVDSELKFRSLPVE